MKCSLFILLCLLICGQLSAAVLVDIPMDKQINKGQGNAITGYTSFVSDPAGGYCEKLLTSGSGAGGWYYGPYVDLVKAGYGPYVNMSGPATMIQYTARYFQGGGNTNPYGDAPIFVQLTDNYGRTASLDISYGARPNPTYPSWITCTDDMTNNNPSCDLSKITKINFYGTDWAGTGSDKVDIKGFKVISYSPIAIGTAKTYLANQSADISGIVTAVFPSSGTFYVEDSKKIAGIQVRSTTLPAVGTNIAVSGKVGSDPVNGEICINADSWQAISNGVPSSTLVSTRMLGGGALGRQRAVENGYGINNIGLLVKLAGRVTGISGTNIYISDGTDLSDGGAYPGVRADMSAVPSYLFPSPSIGDAVTVTGISTMFAGANGKYYRMVRARNRGDYANTNLPLEPAKTFKVYVVNFDPYCPSYGNRRTHQVLGWNDPHKLTTGYVNDLLNCSGRWANYQVVDWYDANYHPYFEDGFQYTPDNYISAWNNRGVTPMHSGTMDYIKVITDKTYPHNQPRSIAERIASGEIDEVFFFGAPSGAAMWEAAMAGPSPFFINGGTYYVPSSTRNFALMGFNYERGVGEMLEDFCHRTECVMSRVYSPPQWWFPTWPIGNNWDRFRMYDQIYNGAAACGITHFAPNSISDYDWGNQTYVWSTCDDWLYNWPNLKGDVTKRWMNCAEWGYGDIRLHHIWWLNHLPKALGINPDSRQNSWWKYTCDFDSYPESR